MSTQLITNYYRLHNVKQFKESISEAANSVYYVFAAKHTPYDAGDDTIPSIINSVDTTFYQPYQEMIFGKRVKPSDAVIVAPRYNWTSGTVYTAYDSVVDLTDKQYYVCVNNGGSSYSVFKCMDNNGNTPSTVQPDYTQTSPNASYYQTSDGYQWKYMYSLDTTTFNTFATADYLPIVANTQVSGNAVSGAIEVITVNTPGSNYNTFLTGTFTKDDLRVGGSSTLYNIATSASPYTSFYTGSFLYLKSGTGSGQGRKIIDYYAVGSSKTVVLESAFSTPPDVTTVYEITPSVLITGNGTGALARAMVNTNAANGVSYIQIINKGSGYTYASAIVVGNTGGVSNAAVITPVLGPKNGHGYDPEYELGGSALCLSVSFANTEVGTIPVNNDYRKIGVLKDPLFANVIITTNDSPGVFGIGETVTQANTNATGVVAAWDSLRTLQLTNVNGIVLTGNSTVNYLTGSTSGTRASVASYEINGKVKDFNTFDQREKYTFSSLSGTAFIEDEKVWQTDISLANAYFHSNTSTTLYLTNEKGALNTGNTLVGESSGATANLLFHYPPDLIPGSGEVLYVENENVITRSDSQTETIKIILQF